MLHQSKTHQPASLIFLLLITVALPFTIPNVSAQQRTQQQSQASAKARQSPHTVLDFYMLLTSEEMPPLESIKNRKSIIEVQDIRNGYIKLNGSYWEGSGEIALFKKTDGSYIVALVETGCGPICSSSLKFLRYQDNRWLNVTEQLLPEMSDALLLKEYRRVTGSGGKFDAIPVLYDLPRIGKSIKVGIDSGADDALGNPHYQGDGTVLKLNWNGQRFVLEKVK